MKCSCGQIFEKVPKKCRGKYATCGCHWDNYHLKRVKDKVGNSYLLLKVEKILRKENGHYILQMKCKCGNRFERKNGHEFKSGSCGCLISKNNPREDKKGNARFKNYEILSIREFYEAKTYSLEELAEMFNCTPHYIWRIVKGKIWKSLLPASE
jgi:hypothetical protein